jgi:hypothetical protein
MGNLLHVKLQAILIYNALVLPTFILRPFYLQNFSNTEIINYNPSVLGDNKTASSAKAMKKIYKVASSKTYRFYYATLYFSKYYNKYGYTWSKNILNSLGDAPSPCFTPVLAVKLYRFCPLIHTIPLLFTYIFLIMQIISSGIFILVAMSSHNVVRSTRSYALLRSTNISPSGDLELTLYYTNCWMISAYSVVVWFLRNPAWVGASSWFSSAIFVKR